jgi:uncharacterized protein
MTTAVLAPSSMTGRSIAPDLARGAMLLFIVIANSPLYLWTDGKRTLSSHPVVASELDRVIQSISIVAIDGRTYPMFAFLFGYGIWQLYSRQIEAGVSRKDARRLLRHRHWWMLAFGLVHAALLWMGDIIGAYGLAGLLLTWIFLDRRDKTLKAWAIVFGSLLLAFAVAAVALAMLLSATPAGPESNVVIDLGASMREPDYLASIVLRLEAWVIATPAQGLGLVVPAAILLAFLAARHRVLEQPLDHLPLLRRTAVIGIGTGWLVGALAAAQNANALGLDQQVDIAFAGAVTLSGLFCGIGYVAAFALVAARMQQRGTTGVVASALQAVGKRSLTFYLAQSLVFAPVMSAWGLGLGGVLSTWSIVLIAIGTWLLTVLIAVQLERRGVRGPAEWLLRRLAYPAPGRSRRERLV